MQKESVVIILVSSQSKNMASEQKQSIPSSDPDNVVQIPLSDYAKRLDGKVRERYLKKISTIGIDSALIVGKHFEPDCLPPVEWTDLLCHLFPVTSFYTQKQLKTFCSQARGLQSNGFGVCLQSARTYHRKQVCCVGKSVALSANERGLNPNNCLQDVISRQPSVKSHLLIAIWGVSSNGSLAVEV